ncbi:hypothetical protein BZA05DRAFT_448145 [Tricharina praecox]|uniref:uncharacterized protein n=1 Tax=Tricharina praecox TaxID=43433 RepID=UPI0022204FF4|nr:uncharacterized protein BZA05DRAFT_448145 [Tricharina praecox]KAI5844940.1 hypothetical protein BZA05DRAFT_448145 [Tricharina praecox]
MATVRDPTFWHRFSLAVRMEDLSPTGGAKETLESNEWLRRQQTKRRRHKILIAVLGGFVLAVIVAGVVVWQIFGVSLGR